MRVLVTGGAGFIGSHLVDACHSRGAEVAVVDDLSTGRLARLSPDTEFHKVNVLDDDALVRVFRSTRPEVVVHLAAQVDVRASVTHAGNDARVNIGGTINVCDAALRAGARVVLASTGGAIYGTGAPIPTRETYSPKPESPYGVAKFCAEQYLACYNRLHHTQHSILRLGNVFGPRQDTSGEAGVVAVFAGRVASDAPLVVFGDGTQRRDYVYATDVCRAFMAAADLPDAGVWNIGTGRSTSVNELVDTLAAVTGRSVDVRRALRRSGEVQNSALDVTAARRDLGFATEVSLEDGIRRVYEWVLAGAPERGVG
jgi:UDP-glucose 4-epimerase